MDRRCAGKDVDAGGQVENGCAASKEEGRLFAIGFEHWFHDARHHANMASPTR
jgi:hypothetical protein